jgi:shikimate dehydrogenase
VGDSTDGPGFLAALAHAGASDLRGRKVVVLGAGGSARAVVYALAADAGAHVVVANRNEERAQALAREFALLGDIAPVPLTDEALRHALHGASVLVNTTSAGMHPHEQEMPPVPADALGPDLLVSDLIYNPAETRLLALARARAAAPRTASRCWCDRAPSPSSAGRAPSPRWRSCAPPCCAPSAAESPQPYAPRFLREF